MAKLFSCLNQIKSSSGIFAPKFLCNRKFEKLRSSAYCSANQMIIVTLSMHCTFAMLRNSSFKMGGFSMYDNQINFMITEKLLQLQNILWGNYFQILLYRLLLLLLCGHFGSTDAYIY